MGSVTSRWESPAEWLMEAVQDGVISSATLVHVLLEFLSSDDIQNVFEAEMTACGYFEVIIGRCKDCGRLVAEDTGYKCADCHEVFHENKCTGPGGYRRVADSRPVCWDCAVNVVEYESDELELLK